MSEYTPTTEEARNAWVCCIFESGGAWVSDTAYEDARWDEERAEAQFDRWLAAHDEQVRAEERERIAQAVAPLLNELESTPSTGYYAPRAEATQVAIFKEIRGGAPTMTTDDTTREALFERVESLLMDERDKYPRVHNDAPSADLAEIIVDTVVMPLVQERAEAWERGYMFAFAQERGDHTHSRPVPDYLADDIRSWNPYLTTLNQTPEKP